ncbi:MAG: hypothetical protein HQK69_10730, partial [Desulfamplus sp.]|nr:hypothetical protein [Desulfamplus sp.]
MSEITLIGLNHKTAAVELREALAFTAEESANALKSLIGNSSNKIKEAMIFSTCNRMEILFISEDKNGKLLNIVDKSDFKNDNLPNNIVDESTRENFKATKESISIS